jgi:hypothetical protein
MNLMKWLRKNNKKLMAIVVIVLMVAFIGGSSFRYLFRGSGGIKAAVAYFDHDRKISHLDLQVADQEVEIVTALGGDGVARAQGIAGLLMSELVFRQNNNAAAMDMARQAIQKNRYRISDRQLAQMFNTHGVPGPMFWILLCNEAQTAGIHVPNEQVGRLLEQLIPQVFEGRTYAQVMPGVMNRFGVPEDTILATFGKLIAVLQYSQVVSSAENVTSSQIRHMASNESESLSAELVQLKASYFVSKDETPPEDVVKEQFNKYKDNFPGQVSESNPYGFGYRLPDRVQFDYLALKLSDVAAIAKPPTQEEAEQYYQLNRDRQFTQKTPSDPNDPNSPQVAKLKSYAEVADTIMSELRRQRITIKAEQILQEARLTADANLPAASSGREPVAEQRSKKAGDYSRIATALGKKYNLPLYSGRTGQLSVANIQSDKVLRRMFLPTSQNNAIPLTQILFSVRELGDHATILLSLPPAALYVSIGPVKDPMSAAASDLSSQVMMIARITDAQKSAPPTGSDLAFSTKTLGLGSPSDSKSQSFSVEEQVVNDIRTLSAWETTRAEAEEFKALATKNGWDKAVNEFNKLYGKQAKADPNDPNVFRVDHQAGLQRISGADLQVLAAQASNSPASQIIMNQAQTEGRFVNGLYALIPDKATAPAQMPLIVEFKPNQAFYVLKTLTMQRLTQEEFQKMKGMLVRREEYSQIESLAAVYFSPESVIKRTNFRFANPAKESAEDETQQQSKEASE